MLRYGVFRKIGLCVVFELVMSLLSVSRNRIGNAVAVMLTTSLSIVACQKASNTSDFPQPVSSSTFRLLDIPLHQAHVLLQNEASLSSRAVAVAVADHLSLAAEVVSQRDGVAFTTSATLSPSEDAGNDVQARRSSRSDDNEPGGDSELISKTGVSKKPLPVSQQLARAAFVVGEVRKRSFRTFHHSVDGREAVVQYEASAQRDFGDMSCKAKMAAILLRSEMDLNLPVAYASLFQLSRSVKSQRCSQLIRQGLNNLQAYRPSDLPVDIHSGWTKHEAFSGSDTDENTRNFAAIGHHIIRPQSRHTWQDATIESVQSFSAKEAARVVVRLSHVADYEVGALASEALQGERVYVDFFKTHPHKSVKTVQTQGLVQRVRVGTRDNSTRVVVDLQHPAQFNVFYLPQPFRVVIDLTNAAAISATAPHIGTSTPASHASTGSSVGVLVPRAVRRVVLDPGHGGSDPGAIGPSGLQEKDVTLDIVHRVAPILSREMGIMTMLTRDNDRFVQLEERTARANAFGADLFLSVHCNASVDEAASGVQSYVLSHDSDAIAHMVAARENATSMGQAQELASIISRLHTESTVSQSKRFANLLQRSSIASLSPTYGDVRDGGVRSAAFFVLMGAKMPAVLFETSFISNPHEESRLASAQYRQKLADAIANAVRAYQQGHE